MTYPLPTNYTSGSSISATAINNQNSLINSIFQLIAAAPMTPTAQVATTGVETFTIASGSVTTIAGTTIDGVTTPSLAVSSTTPSYVLIKDAPLTTGSGSPNSSSPANGLYVITAIGSNISVQRATVMSAAGPGVTPAGLLIGVMAGTANGSLAWFVVSPNVPGTAFTYGTTNIQFQQAIINPSETITLQNKRVTKRIVSVVTPATPAINTDNCDVYKVTALANAIGGWTVTGTPNDRDDLWITITDNGTIQQISWSGFSVITNGYAQLPNCTSPGRKITMHFIYDNDYTTWVLMAADNNGYA